MKNQCFLAADRCWTLGLRHISFIGVGSVLLWWLKEEIEGMEEKKNKFVWIQIKREKRLNKTHGERKRFRVTLKRTRQEKSWRKVFIDYSSKRTEISSNVRRLTLPFVTDESRTASDVTLKVRGKMTQKTANTHRQWFRSLLWLSRCAFLSGFPPWRPSCRTPVAAKTQLHSLAVKIRNMPEARIIIRNFPLTHFPFIFDGKPHENHNNKQINTTNLQNCLFAGAAEALTRLRWIGQRWCRIRRWGRWKCLWVATAQLVR